MKKNLLTGLSVAAVLLLCAKGRAETIVQVSESAFTPQAGLITFSEYPVNTMNPVYAPATYGGGANAPTVTFGGYFTGQTAGAANPSACPAGAAVTGCVLGNPTGPLSLDPKSPQTFITTDSAQPTSPVLSGSPLFNGSIAILFSTPQAGVGLTGGYFDSIGSTGITAFGADGTALGTVSNSQTGDEFLGLVTSDGAAAISGLEFHLVGDEPFGFDVDNIRFGQAGQVIIPPTGVTPEPSSLLLLGTGFASVAGMMKRRIKRAM